MTTTTPDAVDALMAALNYTESFQRFPERDENYRSRARAVKEALEDYGFTITRAEPQTTKKAYDYDAEEVRQKAFGVILEFFRLHQKDITVDDTAAIEEMKQALSDLFKFGTKPSMSEAELERELMAKAWKEVPMGGAYLLTVEDAIALAKKYRG